MDFLKKLKKATQPHFLLMSGEVSVVQKYLKIDWIAAIVEKESDWLLGEIKRFSAIDNVSDIPRPCINEVFVHLIKTLLSQGGTFPRLNAALFVLGLHRDDLRGEVMFQLMLRNRIERESEYLKQVILSVIKNPQEYTTQELVIAIESGCIVYKNFIDHSWP